MKLQIHFLISRYFEYFSLLVMAKLMKVVVELTKEAQNSLVLHALDHLDIIAMDKSIK